LDNNDSGIKAASGGACKLDFRKTLELPTPGKYLQTAGIFEMPGRPACIFRSFVRGMAAQ